MEHKAGKRHVEIPNNDNSNNKNNNKNKNNEDNGTSVIKLVKATTPKGLREVKNVLRWRVPNESNTTTTTTTTTATEAKSQMNYNTSVDRPRSAPSSSLSDPPDKIIRVNSFNRTPTGKSNTQKSKVNNVHKRHWMYLYDNLHRAVDEMYKTCEQDFSVEQCINVVHTLELCMEDFKRLVHKIRVLSGAASDEKKSRSIAWDEPYPRSAPTSHAPSPATPPHTPILFSSSSSSSSSAKFDILEVEEMENNYPPFDASLSLLSSYEPSLSLSYPSPSLSPSPPSFSSSSSSISLSHPLPLPPPSLGFSSIASSPSLSLLTSSSILSPSVSEVITDGGLILPPPNGETKEKVELVIDIEGRVENREENNTENNKEENKENGEQIKDAKGLTGQNGEIPWAERLKRSLSQSISTPKKAAAKRKPTRPVSPEFYRRSPAADDKQNRIKHRSPQGVRLRQDEKQAKASKNREQYVNSKKEKLALALSRAKDVSERKSQKLAIKQMTIEEKQEKAVIIHEAHIDQIKRKATAENTKVDEVAYITTQITETRKFIQQKRLDDTEARRQGQIEGKKKKLYVQAAKEEAVVERKKQIDNARLQLQLQNDVLGSPPNGGNINIRKSPTKSKSPSKSPTRKSGSKIDLEMQARRLKRVCKYCNVELFSDEHTAAHLSSRKHQQAIQNKNTNISFTSLSSLSSADDDDTPATTEERETTVNDGTEKDKEKDKDKEKEKEREKESECILTIPLEPNLPYLTMSSPAKIEEIAEAERFQKKKAKKTKLAIAQLALAYSDPGVQAAKESPHKSRLVRSVTDLKSLLAKKSFSTMSGVLSDISRVLGSKGGHMEIDLQIFRQLGGIDLLANICGNPESKIPYNVFSECVSLLSLACTQESNRIYMVMTGRLVPLIDLLNKKILMTPEASFLPALATLLTLHFWQPVEKGEEIKQQTINYMIQICVFEKMEQKIAQLQTHIDGEPSAGLFIEKIIELIESITAFFQANTRDKPIYVESAIGSQIMQVLKKTSIVGILSLLASLLLQGRPVRGSSTPPSLPPNTWSVIFSSVKVLNNVAALGLAFLQAYLGDDAHQVELFHLLGHLLWYGSASSEDSASHKRQRLLNEIILLAGYYALQNSRTQETFQWGNSPTILQLLCGIPFQYFSDPRYKTILFPTLIAVCFQNTRNVTILQQEMSVDLIVDYIKAEIETKDTPPSAQVPARFLFKNRFPITHWNEALDFFMPKSQT